MKPKLKCRFGWRFFLPAGTLILLGMVLMLAVFTIRAPLLIKDAGSQLVVQQKRAVQSQELLEWLAADSPRGQATAITSSTPVRGFAGKTIFFADGIPDAEVVAIDSNPDNQALPRFDYLKDGNLTIDFNVMDSDNNSLLVDINYSSSNVEGTGTVIINDVNTLDLNCAGSDFSNSTKCSYDWNIMNVVPGTYYLLVKVSDGSYSDFNVSDNNFAVVALPLISISVPVNGSTTSSKNVSFDVNVHSVWGFDVNRAGIKVYVDGVESAVFNQVLHCSGDALYAGTTRTGPYGDVFKSVDGGATWVNTGDLSGATYVLSLLYVDGNLYAGTQPYGDVFKSTNWGATWVNTGDLSGAEEVDSLLSVDGNLYAGTYPNANIFRSVDGGSTWVNIGNLSGAGIVYSLLSVDGNLYGGTYPNGDVFRSVDGGSSWVNTGDLSGAGEVFSLLSVDGNLYGGTYPNGDVFRSVNGGSSWVNTGELSGATYVLSLLYVDGNLFAGTSPNGNVFKSTNAGATWSNTGDLSGAEYVDSLLSVDGNLYAGTKPNGDVFRSVDGGSTWVNIGNLSGATGVSSLLYVEEVSGNYHCSYKETGVVSGGDYNVTVFAANRNEAAVNQNSTLFTYVTPDVNVVAIDGNLDNQVLPNFDYLVDGNLTVDFNVMDMDSNSLLVDINYSSSNAEGTGTVIINDVNTLDLNCAGSDFSNSTKCSVDWNIMNVSLGTYYVLVRVSHADASDFSASDNNFAVVALPMITISVPVSGSTTLSKTVTFDVNVHSIWNFDVNRAGIRVQLDGVESSVFNPLSHCSSSSTLSMLYAATGWPNGDVFRSVDGGSSWVNTGDLSDAEDTLSLLSVDGVLYAGTYPYGDVFRSSDNGTTWVNTGDLSDAEEVYSLLYVDGNLYAATAWYGDVFRSVDGGSSWVNTGDLSDAEYVYSLLYVDGNLFAGTWPNGDVFRSVDGGSSWVNTGDLSGAEAVYSLLYVDGNLFAGTYPYGDVFRSSDNGTTWVNTSNLSGATRVYSLFSVDGNLFAGTGLSGDVFRSSDNGTTWVNSGDLSGATKVWSFALVDANSYHCSYVETAIVLSGDYNVTVFAANENQTVVGQNSTIFSFVAPAPDVNVVAVDGYSDSNALPSFSYAVDGNLAIDFNVMDSDNNSLLVDINYSSSNVEGTGTVIVNDVNTLDLNCADSDFSNSTTCSYDWDIMSVSPGTYYVLIKVFDGGNSSDFNASDNSFRIVSAVCGNGILESGEECELDGHCVAGMRCSGCRCESSLHPRPSPKQPYCGDGLCSASESCLSCAADCGSCPVCGNGLVEGLEGCEKDADCNAGEMCAYCMCKEKEVSVIGYCGDNVCAADENWISCPKDCGPVCGNGVLEVGEECELDGHCVAGMRCSGCRCESSLHPRPSPKQPYCGDGLCSASESCLSCAADCGSCPVCGNGLVEGLEGCEEDAHCAAGSACQNCECVVQLPHSVYSSRLSQQLIVDAVFGPVWREVLSDFVNLKSQQLIVDAVFGPVWRESWPFFLLLLLMSLVVSYVAYKKSAIIFKDEGLVSAWEGKVQSAMRLGLAALFFVVPLIVNRQFGFTVAIVFVLFEAGVCFLADYAHKQRVRGKKDN